MLQRGTTESHSQAVGADVTRSEVAFDVASCGFADELRGVLAQAYDAILLIDGDGRVRYASEDVVRLLGRRPDALIGTSGVDLLHPDERVEALTELVSNLEGPRLRSATRIVRLAQPDGSFREVEIFGVNTLERFGGYTIGLRELTDRRVSDRVMAADDVLFRRLATISTDLMVLVDQSMGVVYVSPTVTTMLGYSIEAAQALPVPEFVDHRDRPDLERAIAQAMNQPGAPHRLELRAATSDGGIRWVELTVVDLFDDRLVGSLVLHARDVHARRVVEDELRFRAMHDPLTGLPNRYSFVEHLSSATPVAESSRGHTALIFCDLDGFKEVNDRHGHSVGDEVLRQSGERLRLAVRPDDLVARIGGDEFCVVCRGLASVQDAMEIAERIRTAIREPIDAATGVGVGVSIGIAWSSGGVFDGDQLLSVADRAMYVAKSAGRNRVELVSVP
jgi:diguanylate cyclase (GGDEF)-like protein/PAS domain S-box-containing protein